MIKIIAAMTNEGVIGNEGTLPWHISDDLKLFKRLTKGEVVVMGRKTFESLNMPQGLPERINIIITSQKNFKPCRGLYFMADIDVILEYGINCFIIGGASIYKKFLPYANELYISTILRNYKGDTFFPEIYWNNWKVDRKEEYSEFIFEKFVKKSCL